MLVLITVAVGLVAIPRQSFWMDEGSSAFKALMPTLKDWWHMTLRVGGSDVQMPIYMFLLWVWHQLGAASEYALRAVNLPWLILAVLALRRVPWWPLVCLSSPFVLYYSGELRPYAMQIAGGAMAAAALIQVARGRGEGECEGLHATAGASLLLACSSLTSALWALGLWIGALILRPEWMRRWGFWRRVLPWAGAALAIAGFYTFTLVKGYRATGIEGGGLLSIGFGFYELIGLLGLGPGRNELRVSPAALLPALAVLLPAVVCIGGAWCCGVAGWVKSSSRRERIGVVCAVLVPILILAVVALAEDFRVLGRHLSPMIPAVLLPIALALAGTAPRRGVGRLLGGLAVVFSVASALCLGLLERHARDDYRRAAAIGIDALKQGRAVWWQADMNATRYYAYREGGMPYVNAIQVLESEPPSSLMFADVVVINRPDLRHRGVDYQGELKRASFRLDERFTGFEVWRCR